MRLVLAAILPFVGIGCLFFVFSKEGWFELPPPFNVIVIVVACPAMILICYYLFRPRVVSLAELQKAGLIHSTSYHAVRAFGIQDYNDEGPHYFVKLQDGSVLYFVGQYLYDYELIDDDPESYEARRFPCTVITILRHKEQGYILDIECGGEALEPETIYSIQEPTMILQRLLGHTPQDGELISGWRYDDLRESLHKISR